MSKPSTPEDFWFCISAGEGPDDCCIWTGYQKKDKYGLLMYQGRLEHAHRLAWVLTRGPIPPGLCVLHYCDNPPCVVHLFLGTRADNNADKKRKGRHVSKYGDEHWTHQHPEVLARGEKHHGSKLTDDVVRRIRDSDLYDAAASRLYGVTPGVIRLIRDRKAWKHVL